jgi:hypothetical protein
MLNYAERSKEVVLNTSIAAMVLLGPDNTDVVIWGLEPHSGEQQTTAKEFAARKLRSVGVIGLRGYTPEIAFKEPLDFATMAAISYAFLEHIRRVLGERFAGYAETRELSRVFALEDTRPN